MWAVAFTVLKYVWPYLIGAAILGAGYYKFEGYCNHACVDQRTRADKLQTEKTEAQTRATALALLWSTQVAKTESEVKDAQAKDAADYATQQDNVRHLSALPTLSISVGTVSVLQRASDFANAAPAPASNQVAAQTISEATLGQYALDAADAYLDAYTHWQSCTAFYEGLRGTP